MTRMTPADLETASPFEQARRRRMRAAREQLMLRHLPLAYRLARSHAEVSDTPSDVTGVAIRGLVSAAESFDPTAGDTFEEHAEPLIVAELQAAAWAEEEWGEAGPETLAAGGRATIGAALARQLHVRELAGFLGVGPDALVDGLMAAAERDPGMLADAPGAGHRPIRGVVATGRARGPRR